MCRSLMNFGQNADSLRQCAAIVAASDGVGSTPSSTRRVRTDALLIAFCNSALSLSMISFGVPAGTTNPC